jgi:hypothetical protein
MHSGKGSICGLYANLPGSGTQHFSGVHNSIERVPSLPRPQYPPLLIRIGLPALGLSQYSALGSSSLLDWRRSCAQRRLTQNQNNLRRALIRKACLACNERKYKVNYKFRTAPTIKLFNQSIKPLYLTKPKSLILASLLVGALVTLLSGPVQAAGPSPQDRAGRPANTFSILLEGPYKAVAKGHGPDLGLTTVDLSDGSFSKTKIFSVSGLPEEDREHANRDSESKKPIGTFYVELFAGSSAAYDLPGGAISMVFTGQNVQEIPDGEGGTYIVGTFELDIPEGTGIYQSFVGGHNTMVDVLHHLADNSFVERCICIISRPVV